MNNELRELYQEVIIDHGRRPRNFKVLQEYSHSQEGYNPLCGDRLQLFLLIRPGPEQVIEEASFLGEGCAISMASASLLTECLKGKTIAEAQTLFQQFHQLLTGDTAVQAEPEKLGKLQVLAGVRAFPTRIKCATLAWHALLGALNEDEDKPEAWVTTE
ncbi:Fe-S cluster assembly sulfur transfer protein SufU [Amphritea balenae]|uniref:SUF system NifU family Fe-S cluster assembly protein n=1 Tax=Amphritea balenae TaxID=452629 RepID=A0A3P1SXL6_9GAMM|nr:SUF system NifU family Fe-S cluster assembly protein [Amphritea balenae]RRD01788.1 SUF system NifU family Fe-S cluster assembly protein [Amphritea balenae]GGK54000.1 iron-sulfur cluster assembly scaffold protein [Amphritea balenae]